MGGFEIYCGMQASACSCSTGQSNVRFSRFPLLSDQTRAQHQPRPLQRAVHIPDGSDLAPRCRARHKRGRKSPIAPAPAHLGQQPAVSSALRPPRARPPRPPRLRWIPLEQAGARPSTFTRTSAFRKAVDLPCSPRAPPPRQRAATRCAQRTTGRAAECSAARRSGGRGPADAHSAT